MSASHRDRAVRPSSVPNGFEPLEQRALFSAALALPIPRLVPAASHAVHAAPTAGGTGISAEYYADAGLSTPSVTRTDASISFKGAGGASAALKAAGGAQWTGSIAATTTSSYTFSVQGSGGVTLSVNGVQLIKTAAITGGAVRASAPITLVAGTKYALVMRYSKPAGAAANVKLFWAAQKAKQVVVPQSSLFPAADPPTLAATAAGVIGQYFVGTTFKQLAFTRVDPTINFNFGSNSPDPSIPKHTPFSILWTGQVHPARSGNYTFSTTSDDGVRVYVGGQLVIDNFVQQSTHTATGQVALTAGQAYDLKVEYFQNGVGVGDVKLQYALPGGTPAVLSASMLSSTPPATAGLLSVVAAATNEVDLSWTGSATATGYTVSRSVDGGATWQPDGTTPAGATTFADAGLAANATHAYRVVPFGSADTSTASNVVVATTLVPGPASVSATADSPTDLDLTWSDVPGETGFDVLESIAGSPFAPIATTGPGVTTDHVGGLIPGAAYQFEVEALNVNGAPSAPTTTGAATATPTSAPAALAVTGSTPSTISLAWTDTVGEGGFALERSTDGTTWTVAATLPAGTTAHTDTGLASGTAYGYRVRGLSAADPTVESAPSPVATAPTVTAAPANVTATAYSDVGITLAWADVTGEAGFTVLASADGGATYLPVGATAAGVTTFNATPLLPGTAYQYEVEAVNAAGQPSAPSASAAASTPTLPPAAMTAVGLSATSALLAWTPAVAATGYVVERSTDGTTWATVATPSATTVTTTDAGLSAGVTYSYRVRATDAGGASDPSPVAVALTLPAAPAALLAGLSTAQSMVSWPAVTGASSYLVQRSADGVTGWATVSTQASAAGTVAATVANPAASTIEHYRVIAVNATGSSAPSAVVGQVTAPLAQYQAATQMYGETSSGGLYSVDPAGAATTLIGQVVPGSGNIDRSPTDGKVYSDQLGVAHPQVYTWDPTTGNTADIGTVNVPSPITRGTFRADGATFFTTADGSLYQSGTDTIAMTTKIGTLTVVGGGTVQPVGDLAFSPDGTLYMSGGSEIYTVNTTTAVATPLTALSIGQTALTFGTQGSLFATTPAGSQYTLNLTTLAPTVVNNGGVPVFLDLTALPKFDKLTLVVSPATTTFSKGHTGAYQVQVTNAGPDADTGPVTVTATLSAGLTYSGVTGTGWTATAATNATTGVQTVTMTYAGPAAVSTALPTASLVVNVASSAPSATTSAFLAAGNNFQQAGALNTVASAVACA